MRIVPLLRKPVLPVAALALVLTACPAEEPPPPPVEEDEQPPPPVDEDPLALDASCTSDELGYTVSYPADWHVNDGEVLPACSAFDPQPVDVPEAQDLPIDLAVVLRAEPVPFAELSDPAGDPAVDVREREETTVDDRSAVTLELESTGDGLHAAGLVTYRYVVALDGSSLVAETHDVEDAALDFEERRDVLDRMMDSLTFADSAPGTDEPEAVPPLEGEPTTADRQEDGDSPQVSITDVRVGTHDGFDRITIEIGGDGEAGWDLRYDDDPRTPGRGDEVDIEGETVLAVTPTNIAMPVEPDQPEGVEPWDEDRVAGPPGGIVTEVVNERVFEGRHSLFVGLEGGEAPYLVERLQDPQRIVIDLFH